MDIHWDELLNGTLKVDYAGFTEQLDVATSGCIPNHISPRKKHNIYMTAEALRLKNKKNDSGEDLLAQEAHMTTQLLFNPKINFAI